MTDEALLPCPFCGGPTSAISDGGNGLHFRVICGLGGCRAAGPLERCAIDAINSWNTRVASSDRAELMRRVDAAAEQVRLFPEAYDVLTRQEMRDAKGDWRSLIDQQTAALAKLRATLNKEQSNDPG